MRLQIFDVGHGFCGLLEADTGARVLFDAGHSDAFQPSSYLPSQGITSLDRLVITNFDNDHVSDLHALRQRVAIRSIVRNNTLSANRLRSLKLIGSPLTDGLEAALNIHETYTAPSQPINLGPLSLTHFWNSYPTFSDTNNLSLVTFINCGGLTIVIPGDLEVAGWRQMLQNDSFCRHLAATTIFVASHHGRESGYCEDIFTHCNPAISIISDDAIQYDTQDHCYGKHCSGLEWSNGSTRRVLTTRSDGHITITKAPDQLVYQIHNRKGVPPM